MLRTKTDLQTYLRNNLGITPGALAKSLGKKVAQMGEQDYRQAIRQLDPTAPIAPTGDEEIQQRFSAANGLGAFPEDLVAKILQMRDALHGAPACTRDDHERLVADVMRYCSNATPEERRRCAKNIMRAYSQRCIDKWRAIVEEASRQPAVFTPENRRQILLDFANTSTIAVAQVLPEGGMLVYAGNEANSWFVHVHNKNKALIAGYASYKDPQLSVWQASQGVYHDVRRRLEDGHFPKLLSYDWGVPQHGNRNIDFMSDKSRSFLAWLAVYGFLYPRNELVQELTQANVGGHWHLRRNSVSSYRVALWR